jgi:hypothetical protein
MADYLRNAQIFSAEKPERKTPLLKPRRRWKDSIVKGLKNGSEDVC